MQQAHPRSCRPLQRGRNDFLRGECREKERRVMTAKLRNRWALIVFLISALLRNTFSTLKGETPPVYPSAGIKSLPMGPVNSQLNSSENASSQSMSNLSVQPTSDAIITVTSPFLPEVTQPINCTSDSCGISSCAGCGSCSSCNCNGGSSPGCGTK
jgi:hypothetical protein